MPELILKLGDTIVQRYVVDKDLISIGRSRDNDIVIENLSVSRNHARIRRQGNKFVLTDLNSANGTFVNNVRISKTEIVDGDVISIGKHRIEFINKELSDSDLIVEALGADRTMVLDKSPLAVLSIIEGKQKGREYQLTKFETTIGKAPSNDIVLSDDWFLSKKQAIITRRGNEYEIRDLGGFRKTRVNGVTLGEPRVLKHGDVIEFGTTRCLFQITDVPAAGEPTGRVPKELGLEDSIFASVSDLPPELVPQPEPSAEAAPPPASRDDEEWSEAERLLAKEEGALTNEAGIALADIDFPEAGAVVAEEVAVEAMKGQEEVEKKEPAPMSRKKKREREFTTHQFASAAEQIVRQPTEESRQEDVEGAGAAPEVDKRVAFEVEATEARQPTGDEEKPQAQISVVVSERGELTADEKEIALWEAALQNESPVIRRHAAKMLKKLTGKDYAY